MKPKALNEHEEGLLEYLEDIIGTAQYKPAIQEAFEALEKVGEERADRLNRVKMVENQMNALEVRCWFCLCIWWLEAVAFNDMSQRSLFDLVPISLWIF